MFNYKGRKLTFFFALITCLFLIATPVAGNSPITVQNNEMVISTLDNDGSIANIQVLSHLRASGSGTATIVEEQAFGLSSVRNLYGGGKVSLQDNKLSATINIDEGKGFSDLYVLSELADKDQAQRKLPVRVKVRYYLDGKEMPANEIAGKSGHLKIVTELENLTGTTKTLEFQNSQGETSKSETTVFTPYVVSLNGWEFDNNIFSNVKAPGVAGESPEGVIVDNQGKTTVSWTVPLIPPSYPASQYTTLEADGVNITLPSFNIVVIPIVPVTSAQDTLGSVQDSLAQLYNAFAQIEEGIGSVEKDSTILFGLNSLKTGLGELAGGINSLGDKVKTLGQGISNPRFNPGTFDRAKGVDNAGQKPGVKEAIQMSKEALDTQVLPALEGQKQVISGLEDLVGKADSAPVEPSAATSLQNDALFLKGTIGQIGSQLQETPYAPYVVALDNIVTNAMLPKMGILSNNLNVLKDGGNLVTANGAVPFPASIATVEQGVKTLSASMGQTISGLDQITTGIGPVDASGQAVKVLVDGKPATILYALSYFNSSINDAIIPGIDQLIAGSTQIGAGAVQAQGAIAEGLDKMLVAPAIVSALEENATQANRFLTQSSEIEGTATYVFQTPQIALQENTMYYGIGAIVGALIVLLALGRVNFKQTIKGNQGVSA